MADISDNPAVKKTVTCIFVVDGREVIRRDYEQHPGMKILTLDWPEKDSLNKDVVKKARFYWNHVDGEGNHIFFKDSGNAGDQV